MSSPECSSDEGFTLVPRADEADKAVGNNKTLGNNHVFGKCAHYMDDRMANELSMAKYCKEESEPGTSVYKDGDRTITVVGKVVTVKMPGLEDAVFRCR